MNGSVRETLVKLLRLPESRFPCLSVYLDTKLDAPEKQERTRIFLKNKIREVEGLVGHAHEARASFATDAERVLRFVERELHTSTHDGVGHAIFACSGDGVFETIHAARPFENQLLVSTRPVIRQLAILLDEYEPVVAAVLDTRRARIFELALGGLVGETELQGDVPRAPRVPEFHGFGDLKYQRDVKGHIDHHLKDVADHLGRLCERGGYRRIVLLGQEPVIAAFRKVLPKRQDEKVVATGPADRREATDRVVARVLELVEVEERRAERELVKLIQDQTLSGNLGVLGLEATLEALRKGQVYKLVVDGALSLRGFRCRGCQALITHTREDSCPHCRGEVDEVELGDEIVKDAIASGAEIETVGGSAELARMGKVGALLRYKE